MKRELQPWVGFLIIAFSVFFIGTANAQVTNLSINHSGTTFSMVSGDTVYWQYDVPPGSTTTADFWLDVNQNGTIDPGTDIFVLNFVQTDGDTLGNGGPPDLDRTVNGHILFAQRVGFFEGHYILRFTNNASSESAVGTVSPLPSPEHTVSGTVTPPPSRSAKNLVLQIERKNHSAEEIFWTAMTDSLGLYTFKLNADTAGPWNVRFFSNPFPGSVQIPADTELYIVGNPTGVDFMFTPPAAQVTGILKNDNNQPVPFQDLFLSRNDFGVRLDARTDVSGFFQFGILSGLLNGQTWTLGIDCNCPNGTNTTELFSNVNLPVINLSDSLYRSLTLYAVNSQITGQVTIDGLPVTHPVNVTAYNDTAQARSMIDTTTGNFVLNVTDKIYNYTINLDNIFPPNYSVPVVQAHPGQSGVNINIIIESVIERLPGIPSHYALEQNYPNPFNPATTIRFDLPEKSTVVLKVYDLLGREVASLVNGVEQPGILSANWNANNLTSGVYFYRLEAASVNHPGKAFNQIRKMLLMK